MAPDPKDETLAASAAGMERGETASAFETGRGAPATQSIDISFLAPPVQPDEIGRLGHYRILSVLGHGGMGLVFRAEDPSLKRQVAVKVMLPRYASDSHARARFIREAQAQAAVEHDHIVPIFGVVDDNDPPFIVMPLLKGMTLADALKANARPPLPAIVRIGREIAEGLAAAHECGLIHRDIKPANIWLEGSKLRVRILDFGLARAAESTDPAATGAEPLTADGAVVGTPMYMSPEQARGEDLDCRTDLFSLGVILFQMATGELPFKGKTTASVLLAVVSHEPKGLEAANLPPALRAIIERLLTKDRDAAGRPAAAEVVAYELKQIEYGLVAAAPVQVIPLDSIPSAAAPPNPFDVLDTTDADVVPEARAVREKKPLPNAWLFGGVAALIAVVAAAGVMFKVMTKTDPPVVKSDDEPPAPVPKVNAAPTPKLKEPGVIPNWDQRKALEAVLELGGTLTIRSNDQTQVIPPEGKLPPGSFQTTGVNLRGVPLDEAKVDRLRALPPVSNDLLLTNTGITGAEFAKLAANPAFTAIRFLDLTDTRIEGEGYAHLEKFPALTKLDLTRTPIAGTDLKYLRNHQCEWLAFHACPNMGDDGLENLAGMKSLTHLWFMYTPVTEKGLAKLTSLEKLRYLHPGSCSDAGVPSILKFGLMEDLHLSGSRISAKSLPELAKLPKLRYIHVSASMTEEHADLFAAFPLLDSLSWHNQGPLFTDAGLAKLQACKRLLHLNVSKTQVTKPAVDAFSQQMPLCAVQWDGGTVGPRKPPPPESHEARKALEWVIANGGNLTLRVGTSVQRVSAGGNLPYEAFTVDSLNLSDVSNLNSNTERLQTLPAITTSVILPAQTTAACFQALTMSPGMLEAKVLGLENSVAGDAGLQDVSRFPKLSEVRLSGTSVTGRGLEHLRNIQLSILLLSRCRGIDDSAADTLAALQSLTQLTLDGTGFTDAGIGKLAACPKLTVLDVRNCKVSKVVLESLSEKLPNCAITYDGGTIGPRDMDRVAAMALRRHQFSFKLIVEDGTEHELKPTDPLPSTTFQITTIVPPNSDALPVEFVRIVLLPAIAPLKKLQYISDFWFVTNWTESDLATLAGSPAAANLIGLRCGFELTATAAESLKRMPKLASIGCRIGTAPAWGGLREIPRLNWLVLSGTDAKPGVISEDGWTAILERKYGGLELCKVVIDAKAAGSLGKLGMLANGLVSIDRCPGAQDHFAAVAQNAAILNLNWYEPTATNDDLVKLHAFKHLRTLVLTSDRMSKPGVEALSQKLPNCTITWQGETFGSKK